jgi:hypothetical protein
MWNRQKKAENQSEMGGGDFDAAAARVTAEPIPGSDEEATRNASEMAGAIAEDGEDFIIREEWAEATARICFVPAAKLIHPAYALTDDEAESISPQMQAFLQAVADKYAPAAIARIANRYPELVDLVAALGILYYRKWKFVSRMIALEAQERARREAAEKKSAADADANATEGIRVI